MAESAIHEGIRNFNAIAALDEIVSCFLGEKDFPQAFFAEFLWDPRSLYLTKQARLSSVTLPALDPFSDDYFSGLTSFFFLSFFPPIPRSSTNLN